MDIIAPEKYISPFTDFGFKKLFGTEVNKDLLMDFLNELIKEKGKITEIKYLSPEQLGRTKYDRKAVFDVFCQTETGEKFIVEMQKSKHDFFKDRSIFYASFPIREQAQKGEWNYELKAVYLVGILDFIFNENKEDKEYFYTEVKLMDTKKKTVFYEKLAFIYLEMPKFNKTIEQLETRFDKWLYVLKHLPRLQKLPQKLQEKIFEKAFRVAEIAKMTVAELAEYENSLKNYRDWYSSLTTAENEKARKIALKMLERGISINDISDMTELPIEQLEELTKRR
jgi:predicted transposase/invertase (TIGR01784 family)